jgi:hypothetical protein
MNPEILTQLPMSASQTFETLLTVFFEGILTPKARTKFRKPSDHQNQVANLVRFVKPRPTRED